MNNCGAYLIPFNRCKQVAIPLQYVGLYVGDYVLRTLRSDIKRQILDVQSQQMDLQTSKVLFVIRIS